MPVSLKISDLSFINGANLTDSDLFLVTDTESRTSKKLSFRTLKSVINDELTLGGLRGIDLSTIPPSDGDTLKFENGRFVPGTFSLNSLGELDDIDLSVSPTDGQVLVWEGASSKFKPVTIFIPDASDYYTKTEVDTAISNVSVDLSGYYTKTEVDTAISNVSVDLSGYYTKTEVDGLIPDTTGFATITYVDTAVAGVDFSNYYTKAEVDTEVSNVSVDLSGYYTKTEIDNAGFLTSSVSGDLDVDGKVYFKNVFSALEDLPSASTYHGMFAHVHGTGYAYYAHGGNWIQLANYTDIPTVPSNLGDLGDVTISGTPTTGHVLKWDGSAWTPAADSGGGGGGGISLQDLSVVTTAVAGGSGGLSYNDVTGVFTFTQASANPDVNASSFTWDASLIPDTNATYDLGSAEYKVRHLFLSDNSIKFESGDLGVDNGKVTFEGEALATEAYVGSQALSNITDAGYGVDVTGKIAATDGIDIGQGGNINAALTSVDFSGATINFGSAIISGLGSEIRSTIENHINLSTVADNLVLSWDAAANGGNGDFEWVAQTGGGATSFSLTGLDDVDANDSPSNDDVIVYDASASKFKYESLTSIVSSLSLQNIVDDPNGGINVTGVIDTTGINVTGGNLDAPGANLDFSNTTVNFQNANITGLSSTINDQIDFKLDRYNAADGQVLTWDGTNSQFTWSTPATGGGGGGGIDLTDLSVTVNSASGSGNLEYDNTTGVFAYTPPSIPTPGGGGGASTLDGLTDVSTANVATGRILEYDGTSWVTSESVIQLTEFQQNILANTAVSQLDFSANNTTGSSPLNVSLSTSYVGNANKFDVDWGDGTQEVDLNSNQLSHTYNNASGGQFDVTLTAKNTGGVGFGSTSVEGKTNYITLYTPAVNVDFGFYSVNTGGSELTGNNLYYLLGDNVWFENQTLNASGVNATFSLDWGDTLDLIQSDGAQGGVDGLRRSHTYTTDPGHGGMTTVELKITGHDTADPSTIPASTTKQIKLFDPNVAAPAGLAGKLNGVSGSSARLCSGFTNNSTESASAGGTVTRVDSGTAYTSMSAFAYNAESGNLRSRRNGTDTGMINLGQPHSSTAVDGELELTQESDYNPYASNGSSTLSFANSIYHPGLYKGFKARTKTTVSNMSDGVNSLQLSHSETGDSNVVTVCKDSDVSPTVDLTGATLVETHNGAQKFISGIPHYSGNNPSIEFRGIKVNNLTGQMYPSANTDIITIADAVNHEGASLNAIGTKNFNYNAIDGAVTMLDGGYPIANTTDYTIGDISINTLSNTKAAKTLKVRAKNANGYSSYATFTDTVVQVFSSAQSTVNINEQNISVPASLGNGAYTDGGVRIYDFKSQTTDTPTFNSAYNFYINNPYSESADPGVAGSSEASVRFGSLEHNVTDYSTGFLPVGPDRSGDTGTQYFTFAFRRQVVANFGINIVSGGIAGCWIAAPGTAIDSSSSLNGWLDTSQAYAGSGVPGAFASQGGNGSDGCATNNSARILTNNNLNGTYNMTLGEENMSNATGNVVLVRVALNAGQEISQLQIREAN